MSKEHGWLLLLHFSRRRYEVTSSVDLQCFPDSGAQIRRHTPAILFVASKLSGIPRGACKNKFLTPGISYLVTRYKVLTFTLTANAVGPNSDPR